MGTAPKFHFSDQRDSDCTLDEFNHIVLSKLCDKNIETHAYELGVQLDSFGSRRSIKRQRLHLEGILNASPSVQERIADANNPNPPIKQGRKGKRVLEHRREIVGREGKGPIDYDELAKRISFPLNLLELWQVSSDASKKFRRLSTRISKKGKI